MTILFFGVLLALTGAVWIYLSYHYATASPAGRHAPGRNKVPVSELVRRSGVTA
ncbi:hypothetical protein GCM10012275_11830 [Longimycelium tulufanense]|uniref:Uncharacterized protein n=1 Tax=Longimycelium tulufanense TaxID=907463 RepID=A0A8J3FVA0_9PSEU|nr:hypothetical protein [Longimycelium tulufanense]GGM42462.1 hypothetical protein GCM10012275_11830 [Longimycelium tulufanense]